MPGHIQDDLISSSHAGVIYSDKEHEQSQQTHATDILHVLIGAL